MEKMPRLNFNQILTTMGVIANPQSRKNVLVAAEQNLQFIGRKLNKLEEQYKQLDEVVQFLKRQQ